MFSMQLKGIDMGQKVHEQFIAQLQKAEQSGDVSQLASMFADDATLTKPAAKDASGSVDATRFWQGYLDGFSEIRSTFSNVVDAGKTAVLEWSSEGKLSNGDPISYRGVSILEIAGDKIQAFRTYYDSAVFVLAERNAVAAH